MPNHPQMSELADEHGMDLHYGRKDKPHVHDWREVYEILTEDGRRVRAWCVDFKNCDGYIQENEILRRLTTIDKLIAHLSDTLDRAEQNPPEHHECVGEEAWWKQRTRMALAILKGKTPTP